MFICLGIEVIWKYPLSLQMLQGCGIKKNPKFQILSNKRKKYGLALPSLF